MAAAAAALVQRNSRKKGGKCILYVRTHTERDKTQLVGNYHRVMIARDGVGSHLNQSQLAVIQSRRPYSSSPRRFSTPCSKAYTLNTFLKEGRGGKMKTKNCFVIFGRGGERKGCAPAPCHFRRLQGSTNFYFFYSSLLHNGTIFNRFEGF